MSVCRIFPQPLKDAESEAFFVTCSRQSLARYAMNGEGMYKRIVEVLLHANS